MTEELISEENLEIISDLANAVEYVPHARKTVTDLENRKEFVLNGITNSVTKFYSRYDALQNPEADLATIGVDAEAIQKIIKFAGDNR